MEYKRLQDCQTPTAAEDKKAIPWEEEPAVSASKVRKLFLFSLLALAMTILFVQLGRKFLPQYSGFVAGAALLLLAIPFHLAGKRNDAFYLVSFFLTAAADGCIVSSYYTLCRVPVYLVEMLLACIPVVAMMLISCVLGNSSFRFSFLIMVVIQILLLVIVGFLWIAVDASIFSFSFFGLLISCFYVSILRRSMKEKDRNVWRDISYCGFGIFIVSVIVVLLILSEGDGFDGFEFDFDLGGTGDVQKKKGRK